MVRILTLLFLLIAIHVAQASPINAIALKNGCRLVQKPSSFYSTSLYAAKIEDWTAYGVMDENAFVGWCSGATSKAPYVFVFELSEDYILEKVRFNNFCQKQYPGICSKDVSVEYSITSATEGFTPLGYYLITEQAITDFDVKHVKARWIRLTISSNYGNTQWTELMEFEALGEFANPVAEAQNIDGVWNSNYDWVNFKKNSNGYQYGCYKWAQGDFFNPSQKRRVYKFAWRQKDNGLSGWCVFVMNKEGTRLNGIWGKGKDTTQFGFWECTRSQAQSYVCDNDVAVKAYLAGQQEKIPVKEKLVEVVIDVIDLTSAKHIPGTVELFTEKNYYTIPSGDGLYTAKISRSSFLIIKTNLPNYFPTTDTVSLTAETQTEYVNLPVYVTRLAVGSNIVLKNILFNKGSAELLPTSTPDLEMIYATMNQYPTMEIELSGHTDNLGDAKKNVVLSEERVKAVQDYLMHKGIRPQRIKGYGYGGRYPIASNAGEKTRKLNRRVELKIIKM